MKSVESILENALRTHQAGDLDAAENLYGQILSMAPDDADALNLLGVLSLQKGRSVQAVDLIRQAIDIKPTIAEYHFNLGGALNRSGDTNGAIESFRRALMLDPELKLACDQLFSSGALSQPDKVECNSPMKRHQVVQAVIDHIQGDTYLEIGVDTGESFLKINARRKFGVDPVPTQNLIKQFLIEVDVNFFKYAPTGSGGGMQFTLNATNSNPPPMVTGNQTCEFYYITSNVFFSRHAPSLFEKKRIDVAFVDGLHTYHQTYQDISNILDFIEPGGVILVHDCNPPSNASAFPATSWEDASKQNLPGWNGNWCGDVWKSIVRLRATRKDLRVFVLDCDFGIGVVCRGMPEKMLDITMPEIEQLTFESLQKDREELLNLKSQDYLFDFLKSEFDARKLTSAYRQK